MLIFLPIIFFHLDTLGHSTCILSALTSVDADNDLDLLARGTAFHRIGTVSEMNKIFLQ